MKVQRFGAVLVLAALLTACTDAGPTGVADGALTPAPRAALWTEEGPQVAPAGAGPEYHGATTIEVEVAAGFVDESVNPDENVPNNTRSRAWGQTLVRYWATDAKASVRITARKRGSVVAENDGESSDADILPTNRGLFATTSAQVEAQCGHIVQATGFGEVWNQALIDVSWMTWGRKKDSDTKDANQKVCEQGPPGTGSFPPGGGTEPGQTCQWHRDYIIYTDGSWNWVGGWYQECYKTREYET